MIILHNARIYTLDSQQPVATAIVVDRGRILAVGDETSIAGDVPAGGQTIDISGHTIIPGLVDAHIHLEQFAVNLQKVDCETTSHAECVRRVADRSRNLPPGEWILGHGWNQNEWPDHPDFGSAGELDSVSPHNPVYLTAKSMHAAWANTAALKLANISAQTPDPPGGRLGKDVKGFPNGILFESAMGLVADAIPQPTPYQVVEAIRAAQPVLWRMGLTGIHDFDRRRCFHALQMLHSGEELKLRVVKGIPLEDLPHAVALGLRSGFGDDFLRIGSIKAFADGALGPRTAAMFAPYEGEPDNRGMLLLDAEELFEHGRLAVTNGLSLAVHAIGDRANHEVLQAFSQLRQLEREALHPGSATLRHRIEHVQIIHPQDLHRPAELDVIASMQPIHATSDYPGAERFWGERSVFSYAWRSLIERGTRLAFGSDAPVDSPNPFWGLHAAITRCRHDGSPDPEGWYPAQRLTLDEALHAYTVGAAYAGFAEDRLGKLAPGFLADLLVLDRDPNSIEPMQVKDIRPLATMIAGEWVYKELD